MVKYRSLAKKFLEGGMTDKIEWKVGREHFAQTNVGLRKVYHYSASANVREREGASKPTVKFPFWRSIPFPL